METLEPFPPELTVDAIVARCKQQSLKFVDGDFAPSNSHLYKPPKGMIQY